MLIVQPLPEGCEWVEAIGAGSMFEVALVRHEGVVVVCKRLRAAVRGTAEFELSRAGRSADGCPFLEKWLAYYEGRPATHLERAIRRYAPAAAGASKALDYLEPLTVQLGQGIARWARTGEMSGVPDELASGGDAEPGRTQLKERSGVASSSGLDPGALRLRTRLNGVLRHEPYHVFQKDFAWYLHSPVEGVTPWEDWVRIPLS